MEDEHGMALREFRDARGVEWKVWATIPEASAVVRVDYGSLGALEGGWLTFECSDVRKRLAPVPADWDTLPDTELERWCSEAKAPPPRRSSRTAAAPADTASPRQPTDLNALDRSAPTRTFTGAGGVLWRVAEHECSVCNPGATGADSARRTEFVLRFSSGAEVLELRTYPMAWVRLADDELLRLVREAERVHTR